MKKCPKCGYLDPDYWRTVRWNGLVDYTHIDNLRLYEPEIAKKLTEQNPFDETVIIGDYAYHIIKNGYIVHRQWVEHWKMYKWHGPPREHVEHIPIKKRRDYLASKKTFAARAAGQKKIA